MIRRGKAPVALIAVTAAALSLAACAPTGSDAQSTGSDGRASELRYGAVVDISTWSAPDAPWGNSKPFLQAVYDTLLRETADGPAPGLATDWSWDDARTTLTLTLRDDVTFSDGEALTAQVVADNLLRRRDGVSEDAAAVAGIQTVTAPDDSTVVISLAAPDPGFEITLSRGGGLIGAPSTLDAPDAQTTPVGSGPYVLNADDSVPGSSYVFDAREGYWDAEQQRYDQLTINVYTDATAMLNAIKGGQVDAANLNSVSQAADAEAAGYEVEYVPTNWKGIVLSDRAGQVDPVLGDVRVRQAINYAIDREALLQAIETGRGEVTSQVFGPNSYAYVPELDSAYEYDPEKARELLDEAGYPDGVTIRQPQTSFVPASDYELVAGMLAESGITIEYEQTGATFIGDLLGGTWGSFQFGLPLDDPWIADRMFIAADSQWNVQRYSDDQVMALEDRMRAGGADGEAAAQELNEYLVDQAWFAPMYRVEGAFVTNPETTVTEFIEGSGIPSLTNIAPAS